MALPSMCVQSSGITNGSRVHLDVLPAGLWSFRDLFAMQEALSCSGYGMLDSKVYTLLPHLVLSAQQGHRPFRVSSNEHGLMRTLDGLCSASKDRERTHMEPSCSHVYSSPCESWTQAPWQALPESRIPLCESYGELPTRIAMSVKQAYRTVDSEWQLLSHSAGAENVPRLQQLRAAACRAVQIGSHGRSSHLMTLEYNDTRKVPQEVC